MCWAQSIVCAKNANFKIFCVTGVAPASFGLEWANSNEPVKNCETNYRQGLRESTDLVLEYH
jgi:hypothetical protein